MSLWVSKMPKLLWLIPQVLWRGEMNKVPNPNILQAMVGDDLSESKYSCCSCFVHVSVRSIHRPFCWDCSSVYVVCQLNFFFFLLSSLAVLIFM